MTAGNATTKLYLADSYTHAFKARLLRCEKTRDGRLAAVLEETFFYPESGGQTGDRGTIAGVGVVDVWEDADVVLHEVTEAVQPGPVSCALDWGRRFDHMQQHTGQHVLSRAFIQAGGLNTISFHMGDDACTIDLDGHPDSAVVGEVERLANTVIEENRTVHIRVLSPDELEDAALRRKLPEDVKEVRLVEVEGFDTIGCCGTHVRRTGELGLVKVLKHERVKGASRVTFKVGRRALGDYATKHDIVKELSGRFTTSIEGVVDKVAKLSEQGQNDRKRVQKLSKRLAALETRELMAAAVDCGGLKLIARVLPGYDEDYLRLLSSQLKTEARTINVLANDAGVVVCNASKDAAVDFSRSAIDPARAGGGSGGGKGGFAMVKLVTGASTEAFVAEVIERVKAEL